MKNWQSKSNESGRRTREIGWIENGAFRKGVNNDSCGSDPIQEKRLEWDVQPL